MGTLGAIAMFVGFGLVVLGVIAFIIAAFQESVLWGIGVLVFPVLQLVFLVLCWDRAKKPFFWQLYGIGLVLVAVVFLEARLPFVHHHY